MGKRRQKVRWTAVGETFYTSGDETSEPQSGNDLEHVKPENHKPAHYYGPRENHGPGGYGGHHRSHHRHYSGGPPPSRRYGSHWNSAPIAPRFERKAAAAQAAAEYANGFDHNGEGCEFEQLPDGFTKIRSKNLDVLFKRDYYAHKIEMSQSNGSSIKEDGSDPEEGDDEEAQTGEGSGREESITDGTHHDSTSTPNEKTQAADGETAKQVVSLPYSPNAAPFIPQSQASRPNLFLYSPSSNTMIPCEEIIIPNPVMGPEGPMYQGPSNIYLAFPMDNGGPVNGYIGPQQYMAPPALQHQTSMPYDHYGVPYQPYHTNERGGGHHSHDNSTYQSSSENGAESHSNDSTCPHSPPDLSMYSPVTWTDGNGALNFVQGSAMVPQSQQIWYQNNECNVPYSGKTVPIPQVNSVGVPSSEKFNGIAQESKSVPMLKEEENPKSVIPGLHPDRLNGKRVQKKKRRKKSLATMVIPEVHRGSSSSEDFFHAQKGAQIDQGSIQNGTVVGSLMSSSQLSEEDEVTEKVTDSVQSDSPTPVITVSPPNTAQDLEAGESALNDQALLNQAAQELEKVGGKAPAIMTENAVNGLESHCETENAIKSEKPTPSCDFEQLVCEPAPIGDPSNDVIKGETNDAPSNVPQDIVKDGDKEEPENVIAGSGLVESAKNYASVPEKEESVKCKDVPQESPQVESDVQCSDASPSLCSPRVAHITLKEDNLLSSPISCPVLSHKEKVPEQAISKQVAPGEKSNMSKQSPQPTQQPSPPKKSNSPRLNPKVSKSVSNPTNATTTTTTSTTTKKTTTASEIATTPATSLGSELSPKPDHEANKDPCASPDSSLANNSSNVLSSEASAMKKLYSVVCKEEKPEEKKPLTSKDKGEDQENVPPPKESSEPVKSGRGNKSGRHNRRSKNQMNNSQQSAQNDKRKEHSVASELVENEAKATDTPDNGGEWETKKRKNRKANKANSRHAQQDLVSERSGKAIFDPQPMPLESVVQSEAVEKKTSVAVSRSEPVVSDKPTNGAKPIMEDREKSEDTVSIDSKRNSMKRKKKRSNGQAPPEKPSIRPVLVRDGVLDVRSGMATPKDLEMFANRTLVPINSLIVSSIGHGIQNGPMDLGRIGFGKYSPPDRTEEIPLSLRQEPLEEEEMEEAEPTLGDSSPSDASKSEEQITTECAPTKSSDIDLD
ncbi:uncharacterized protein LOC131879759 [Tigriopus californicus]|uniref:uncharacterized protein LOC131879759 n=1 Tax=Tigriopus californicus TaxID=6832 RepID=UPI0027DA07A4|nr:uncharacterized protein LOC131879759 [Tigriopus californicus]XP_059082152.1 uncharacterized protein LOC131879759 [Tigriopus californicus]